MTNLMSSQILSGYSGRTKSKAGSIASLAASMYRWVFTNNNNPIRIVLNIIFVLCI